MVSSAVLIGVGLVAVAVAVAAVAMTARRPTGDIVRTTSLTIGGVPVDSKHLEVLSGKRPFMLTRTMGYNNLGTNGRQNWVDRSGRSWRSCTATGTLEDGGCAGANLTFQT
jgi:hypothetical protein